MRRRFLAAPLLFLLLLLLSACGGSGPSASTAHAAHRRSGGGGLAARGRQGLFPPGPYVAVMIDNAPAAWPQSGIDQAPLVYELLAEGGITRYLAFFPVKREIPTIGPVRSTRIGFIDIDEAYGVPLAHAGGNVDALRVLATGVLPNLDEIYGSPAYFWRSPDRAAPHNLYTSSALLWRALRSRHLPSRNLLTWPVGPLPTGTKPAQTIGITYAWSPPTYTYTVGWQWDGQEYQRLVDGSLDRAADGQPIKAADVVILQVASVPDPDPYTPGSVKYVLTSGSGWLCRGGRELPITWSFHRQGGFLLTMADGRPVPFAPGTVWVEVVPPSLTPSFR